jgi:hypothetical protein
MAILNQATGAVKTGVNLSKKHPWVPAAGVGYHYGSKNAKAKLGYGNVQSNGRAENRHPYSGDSY